MNKCFLAGIALCCLLAGPPARADETGPAKPALVLRLNSLENLLADARYLAQLADREELFKQVEALLKARTGAQGIEGLDPKKPIGLYADIGGNVIDSTGALLIPVTDEKAVLGLLQQLALKVEKRKDGLYSISFEQSPFPVLFRFARGYAFVTFGTPGNEALLRKDANLDPAIVFPRGAEGTASVTLYIDRIPVKLKELILGQTELRLAGLKDREQPGETKAQQAFRTALIDEFGTRFKSALKDGSAVDLRLDLDRSAGDLNLSLSAAGKPGSPLAAEIAELGKVNNLAASLLGPSSAISLAATAALPERLRKALAPVIEEALQKDLAKQSDEGKRAALERFSRTLLPTLKAAELDGGVVLRGPTANGTYTFLGVARLKDGTTLEKEFKELMKLQPANPDSPRFTFDVDRAGGVNIHQVMNPKADANYRQLLGDGPIRFAVRDDALFVCVGAKGLDVLKEALTATPKPGKLLQAEMALAQLTPALGVTNPAAPAAAKKAFADHKDADKVRLTLEGGPALQLKLSARAPLITFFSELDKARK